MNDKELNAKFEEILHFLNEVGDLDFILDRIPFKVKEEILMEWEVEQGQAEDEEIDRQIEQSKEDAINEYCDGCGNLQYDQTENFTECVKGKQPHKHPDEPDKLHCEHRKE